MSEAPSWLDTPTNTAAATEFATASNSGLDTSGVSPMNIENADSNANTTAAAATDEAKDKDLPGIILFMRLLNMGAAAALISISIVQIIGIPVISSIVLAVYAICGGLLICCLETQLKFLRVMIAVNFGFLFNSIWRFLFYLILGSVCWSFSGILGKIMAGCLVGVALFNTYILCRYPSYRKLREQIAEEEDKRIEARISKEVKQQAIKQMTKSATGGK